MTAEQQSVQNSDSYDENGRNTVRKGIDNYKMACIHGKSYGNDDCTFASNQPQFENFPARSYRHYEFSILHAF